VSIPHILAAPEVPLPHVEQVVLIRLADFANEAGLAWPSTRTLAERCGLERKALLRSLERLEVAHLIAKAPSARRNAPDAYRLLIAPKASAVAVSPPVVAVSPSGGGSQPPDPVRDPVMNQKERARGGSQPPQSAPAAADSPHESLEAEAERLASTMKFPEQALPGIRERLAKERGKRQEGLQAAVTLLERMSSAKVLRRVRLHR
jgi:hypothetical protein